MRKQKMITSITDDHYKAISWCFRHNIYIYPKVEKNGFKLIVNDNGKIMQSPKIYNDYEMEVKGWDLYLYFYKKYFK
jgi:hypothetical protein